MNTPTLALVFFLSGICAFGTPPPAPFTVWDLDFERETAGEPPRRPTAAECESRGRSPWTEMPVRTVSQLDFITPEKSVRIEDAPNGFRTRALTLHFDTTAQPHWGPRVYVRIPEVIRRQAEILKFSFEMAKNNQSRVSGVQIPPVLEILHYENSENKVNSRATLSRYAAGTPNRYEILVDCVRKKFTARAVGDRRGAVEGAWNNPTPEAPYCIMFSGLFPGGNVGSTGSLSVDNIKLTVEKWRVQSPPGGREK